MTVSNLSQTAEHSEILTLDRRRGDRRGIEESEQQPSQSPKKQRRRHIDPTTCERDYSGDEIEFMRAMDDYKRDSGRMFPTCSEVLEVIRSLGYFKLSQDQVESLGLSLEPTSEEDHIDEMDREFEEELADI